MKNLDTNLLIIRQMVHTDLDALSTLISNDEVMRYSVNGPYSFEKSKTYLSDVIRDYDSAPLSMWALTEKGNDTLIGICGFMPVDSKMFEIGYRILPKFQGKGYATEAAIAVRDYAIKVGIDSFVAFIAKENTSSIRVAEKIGMKFVKNDFYKGIPVLLYEYSL